ncbi:hypothetical protein Tco_1228950 [Tanacetum coccineum]
MQQKEETFQVIIHVIKNSTFFKAFTISAEVPEIFMQQFWYTIKKVQGTDSYEFLLANKKCRVDVEVFQKILDICPRVEGEEFTKIPPKKSRDKGSQGKKTADVSQETIDVSEEFEPELAKKKTGSRSTRDVVIQDTPNTMQALKESKKPSRRQPSTGGSSEGTGRIPGVPDDSTVVSITSCEGTGNKLGVPDEEKVISEVNVILEWRLENESEHSDDSQLYFDDE